MTETINRLTDETYTTEEVAHAVGRTAHHWCRIRHKYIKLYKLEVVKIGRRHYYKKGPVNKMINKLLLDGD